VFTGLIADLGRVLAAERSGEGVRLRIGTPLGAELGEGDSVAVNGVCLTAAAPVSEAFEADVMNETLDHSSLGAASTGGIVNLELPLRAGERLGGHIVQGHVDGTGTVTAVSPDGFAQTLRIEADPELLRYVVHKGSIAVDGVSLTVAHVDGSSFSVSLIPETLQRTNLGSASSGQNVNLEVDVVAKYVEKLVSR
jgi:riboflavin synthase